MVQGKEQSKMIEKPVTKSEMGTQTDTHFYETNIVKTYEWNEWELRRKAIKLANLRQRLTKAAQTNLSNYRREAAIQIWPPKCVPTGLQICNLNCSFIVIAFVSASQGA